MRAGILRRVRVAVRRGRTHRSAPTSEIALRCRVDPHFGEGGHMGPPLHRRSRFVVAVELRFGEGGGGHGAAPTSEIARFVLALSCVSERAVTWGRPYMGDGALRCRS